MNAQSPPPGDQDAVQRLVQVAVLMCCYNRKALTIRALQSLKEQECQSTFDLSVVLIDDGSTDGTADSVRANFPEVAVVVGQGDAYWSRSMAMAQATALGVHEPDYLLWLNDDVELGRDAVSRLVSLASDRGDRAVVVGALVDRTSNEATYSGYRIRGHRPLNLARVEPSPAPIPVDTFNGNVVLVPQPVYTAVGAISAEFEHGYGDLDYGYRVAEAGFHSLLLPGTVGRCSRNGVENTWQDSALPIPDRFRHLRSPKGIPYRSHTLFMRRYAGRFWWVHAHITYVRCFIRILGSAIGSKCGFLRRFGP